MTSGLLCLRGYVAAFTVLFLILSVITLTNTHPNKVYEEKSSKSQVTAIESHHFESNPLKRRKRYAIADLMITDRAARGRAHHSRQTILRGMLLAADTATRGRCRCLLKRKGKLQRDCHCNIIKLLATFLRKLKSSDTKEEKFNELSNSLSQQTKSKLMKVVAHQLNRARRARAIENYKLNKRYRRMWHRGKMIRKHSRAAFDGMQLFSF